MGINVEVNLGAAGASTVSGSSGFLRELIYENSGESGLSRACKITEGQLVAPSYNIISRYMPDRRPYQHLREMYCR